MSYLPHKEYHPLVNSSVNLFNAGNIDASLKHGYYEKSYPQKPLSENVNFQVYSSEVCFIDLPSSFIELHVIVKKSNNEKQVQPRSCLIKIVYYTTYFDKTVST